MPSLGPKQSHEAGSFVGPALLAMTVGIPHPSTPPCGMAHRRPPEDVPPRPPGWRCCRPDPLPSGCSGWRTSGSESRSGRSRLPRSCSPCRTGSPTHRPSRCARRPPARPAGSTPGRRCSCQDTRRCFPPAAPVHSGNRPGRPPLRAASSCRPAPVRRSGPSPRPGRLRWPAPHRRAADENQRGRSHRPARRKIRDDGRRVAQAPADRMQRIRAEIPWAACR